MECGISKSSTDLRCGNPVSTDAWDEHWKVSEVACESYRRFFLRDRKGNEICAGQSGFSDKPSFETSGAFPENDTCISTICVCGISITRLTVEPMPG